MNRGKDYYSLLHEKEQLLAQLHEVEKEIKSKTSDFLEKSGTQPRLDEKATNPLNSKTKNEDFGVLITDGDLDDQLTIRDFYDLEEESTSAKNLENRKNSNAGDPNNSLHYALQAGKPVKSGGEFHFRDKKYELEFIKTPLLINGNTHKVLTLVKDISSQKTSTRATQLLNSVVETTDDFIVVKDLSQKIIAVNQAFVKAMGKRNVDEIIGKSDYEMIRNLAESEKSRKEDEIAQKLKKGESIESEGEFVLYDGSSVDTLVKRFPIYEGEELLATACIYRNITSLKNEHRKLLRNEEKYRMIIENQGEGVCIIDGHFNFIFTNAAAEKLFDAKKYGLIDHSLNEIISEKDFELIRSELHYAGVESTKTFELEVVSLKKTTKFVILTISPFFNDNGDLVGSFILFRDITERRKIEDKLLKSEESLKDIIATKDKFFSIIAHDLKNPFGSIMGFSDLILRKLKTNNLEKIEHYTRIISSASKHGFDLLENLLAWSRSQSGTMKYSPAKVSLKDIIGHNVDMLIESAENKQLTINDHTNGDIYAFIDEDMISTVLRNLISNAIKYSKPNSRITISAKKMDNNTAKVAVSDEGVGMSKSNLEQLFRIDSNKTSPGTNGEEGTGLGLILCKEFIEKNKGKIWAESAPDEGSTFYITLPLTS